MPGKQHLHKTIHQQHDDKKKKKNKKHTGNKHRRAKLPMELVLLAFLQVNRTMLR
jgi:hypothetical protein